MDEYTIVVNGETVRLTLAPDTPLLWALRDSLKLTGTKYGCGVGVCGACTVNIDGAEVRSCLLPISEVTGAVETIEGLADDDPLLTTWERVQVPQCGYCQPGMIMAARALLRATPNPTEQDVRDRIANLCRCGTYHRIQKAIVEAGSIASGNAAPAAAADG